MTQMQHRWARWVGVALLLGATLACWPLVRPVFRDGLQAAIDLLVRVGPFGPLLVIFLQVLQAVIAPLPSWPITVAAGASYGPALGTLYSLLGGILGGAINFALARRLGALLLTRRFGVQWVERASRLRPLHFLLLAFAGRLIPIASFDLVAYLAGISHISILTFLGVSIVGQAPAFLAYALFGSDVAAVQSAGRWGSLLLVLFLLLIALGRRLWRYLMPIAPENPMNLRDSDQKREGTSPPSA